MEARWEKHGATHIEKNDTAVALNCAGEQK